MSKLIDGYLLYLSGKINMLRNKRKIWTFVCTM